MSEHGMCFTLVLARPDDSKPRKFMHSDIRHSTQEPQPGTHGSVWFAETLDGLTLQPAKPRGRSCEGPSTLEAFG